MGFFDKVLSPRNRASDSTRQAPGAYASPIHDDWGISSTPSSSSGPNFDEWDEKPKSDYMSPSDRMRKKESDDRIATSNRLSSEASAHEKRTGLPATFMPNVSRIAPEGTSQASHDAALKRSHQRSEASRNGILHVDGQANGRLDSNTRYELFTRPQDNASTHEPRNSHTITNVRHISVPSRDGLSSTPHIEYKIASAGSNSRHTMPLSEVHGLERASEQGGTSFSGDQSGEWWRN
jgi:hypothetical protein